MLPCLVLQCAHDTLEAPLLKLFILFTAMPVLELMLMIEVGAQVGVFNTIALCLLTGFVGASLARSQGAEVVRRMQATLQRGGLPAQELLDGVLILMAGVVLLTPGFVTDALGILLLLPPTRAIVRLMAFRWIKARMEHGTWRVTPGAGAYHAQWSPGPEGAREGQRPSFGAAEIIPPEAAPKPPRPSPPDIIDA